MKYDTGENETSLRKDTVLLRRLHIMKNETNILN